jgi:hypothetical protein
MQLQLLQQQVLPCFIRNVGSLKRGLSRELSLTRLYEGMQRRRAAAQTHERPRVCVPETRRVAKVVGNARWEAGLRHFISIASGDVSLVLAPPLGSLRGPVCQRMVTYGFRV